MSDRQVEVVDSFVYLGSRIDSWWQQRQGPAEDKHCSDLHESAEKNGFGSHASH